jgi:hypothetical protein
MSVTDHRDEWEKGPVIEEWRVIPGAEDYEASNVGRVRRRTHGVGTRPGRILALKKNWQGYWTLRMMVGGKARTCRVGRLVLMAFTGENRLGLDCNHINSKRDDDRIENLEWATRSENQKHAFEFGALRPPVMTCESAPRAKLNRHQVIEIRDRVRRGEKKCRIAEEFGVSNSTIARAASGSSWSTI